MLKQTQKHHHVCSSEPLRHAGREEAEETETGVRLGLFLCPLSDLNLFFTLATLSFFEQTQTEAETTTHSPQSYVWLLEGGAPTQDNDPPPQPARCRPVGDVPPPSHWSPPHVKYPKFNDKPGNLIFLVVRGGTGT